MRTKASAADCASVSSPGAVPALAIREPAIAAACGADDVGCASRAVTSASATVAGPCFSGSSTSSTRGGGPAANVSWLRRSSEISARATWWRGQERTRARCRADTGCPVGTSASACSSTATSSTGRGAVQSSWRCSGLPSADRTASSRCPGSAASAGCTEPGSTAWRWRCSSRRASACADPLRVSPVSMSQSTKRTPRSSRRECPVRQQFPDRRSTKPGAL